jgi:4-amino-4-deoxy-L-arabinose transferase-like glycosyltransferase
VPRPPLHAVLLAAIVAAGAAVRFWGLGWGLPHTLAHPDETKFVSIALGMGYGDLNPRWFGYPSLFFYLSASAFAVLYAVGRLTGDFPTLFAFKLQFFLDPSPFHLATRSLSALAGTATIIVTYHLGKQVAGRAAGLVAALLVAVNPLHVRSSHFGNTDVTMTVFTAAALVFTLRAARRARTRDFVLAGLGYGLAVSTKYPAAFFAVALLVAALLPGPDAATVSRAARLRALGLGLVAMGAAFAATSPFILLDWRVALGDLRYLSGIRAEGWYGDAGGPAWLYHVTFSMWYGFGGPFYAALILGVAFLAWRRDRAALVLGAGCLVYFVVMSSGRLAFARYMLPLVPPLAALVGALAASPPVARLARSVAGRAALAGALVALLTLPAWRTFGQAALFARTDTRVLAREWIMKNVPSEATVVWVGSGYEFSRPQLPLSRAMWERLIAVGDRPSPLGERDRFARWRTAREMLASPGFPPRPNYTLLEARRLADVPAGAGAPVYVVTPEHPLEQFAHVEPDDRRALAERATLLWEVSPLTPRAARAVFEAHDAIFLPYAGFEGVARPGPALRIYRFP